MPNYRVEEDVIYPDFQPIHTSKLPPSGESTEVLFIEPKVVRSFRMLLQEVLEEAIATDDFWAWVEVALKIKKYNSKLIKYKNYPALTNLIHQAKEEGKRYLKRKKTRELAKIIFLNPTFQGLWRIFQDSLIHLQRHPKEEGALEQFMAAKKDFLEYEENYPDVIKFLFQKLPDESASGNGSLAAEIADQNG